MRTLVALAVLIATPPIIGRSQPANRVLFRDVRVFDGERAIERTDAVIQDGRIQSVSREATESAGATIIEGRGRTLLPGLIDSHVHVIDAQSALEQAAVMGVTTVLDMFSAGERLKALKRMAAEDPEGLADVRTAAIGATAPGGHPTQMGGASDISDGGQRRRADAFVQARIAEGADYIKIVYDDLSSIGLSLPMLRRPTLDALIAAAHRRGKLAVVHALSETHARDAMEAGADVLVHLFRGPTASPGFGTLAAKHRVAIVPTLSVVCPQSEAQAVLTDTHLSPFIRPQWRQMLAMPRKAAACAGTGGRRQTAH